MILRLTRFIASALLFVILFSGCRSQPVRGPHIEDGDDWLSWTPARREAFVKDFLTGYLYGALDTCSRATTLFRGRTDPTPSTEKFDPVEVGTRCETQRDGFSKFRTSPDKPTDVSPYTDQITAFYKNHPSKRHLHLDLQLLGLRDSTYNESVRIYEQVSDAEAK
jgi:hypothetical protein